MRDGALYARGADDNKGHLLLRIQAVEAYRAVHGELPINVRFLIEGEEEVGGEAAPSVGEERHREKDGLPGGEEDLAVVHQGDGRVLVQGRESKYLHAAAPPGSRRDRNSSIVPGLPPRGAPTSTAPADSWIRC